jgi:hypothetical protein
VFVIRVASYQRYTEWHIRKIHASDEFKEFPVGIHCVHLQLLNGLAPFRNQIELGGLCGAGRDRCLKRCRSPRQRLPLYAKQSFVTGTAVHLHKLDTDEINITLRLGLHPISACTGNLRAPLSRFGRTHGQYPAAIQFRDLCACQTLGNRSAGRLRQLELVALCIHRERERNSLGHRVHGNLDGQWFSIKYSRPPEHRCHVVPR